MTLQAANPLDLAGALKRQWWVVVLTTAVALGVAFASTTSVKPSYTATGVLFVGPAALSHSYNAPTPDDMVRATSDSIRTGIVAQGGFTAEEAARVRFAAVGAPQTRITITAEADNAATAEQLVNAAAKAALGYSNEATRFEIVRQTRHITATKAALDLAGSKMTEFERWSLDNTLIEAETNLEVVKSIYTFNGDVSVATTSRMDGIRTTLFGALLLGVFVGLVLGGVREYLWRRRNSRVVSA